MTIGNAKRLATQWVLETALCHPSFLGAYFSGSTVGMADSDELSPFSDVDVVLVMDIPQAPLKLGKFTYHGAMLEITTFAWHEISNAQEVLTHYHLAGSFRMDTIICDPTGCLHALQAEVATHFAEPSWVRRRCENVRQKIMQGLTYVNPKASYADKVNAWLFPTAITAHLILVAALRNPTVRLRYVRSAEVLRAAGHGDFHMEMLNLLGCTHLSPQRVHAHVDALELCFDAAVAAAKTLFPFSSDISHAARPIAIDASRTLIDNGLHHEAIFWIGATFARCHTILAEDAPIEVQQSFMPAFVAFMADLGISCEEDFIRRKEATLQFLPKIWDVAEDIISKNLI